MPRSPGLPSPRVSKLSVDIGAIGHGLAARAPESDARVVTLNAAADSLATAAAGLTGAAIHPQAGAWIGLVCRAPSAPPVSNDAVAGIFQNIGAHQLARGRNHRLHLV